MLAGLVNQRENLQHAENSIPDILHGSKKYFYKTALFEYQE